jgi:RimJ/RimL family protein N-acetyltransferase
MQRVQVIGVVGLNRYEKIHYVFYPNFWGSGYCTEALQEFLDNIFIYQPNRQSLKAIVLSEKLGSRRVLEKCNFIIDESRKKPRFKRYTPKQEYQRSTSTLEIRSSASSSTSMVIQED